MDVVGFFARWPQPLRSWRLVVVLLLYRVALCLTLRTAESPDEWWQSEEVAYYVVFGRGQLTWEWHDALRSYVFPALYAMPMLALKWTGTDTATTVWASSRCVQALLLFGQDCAMLAIAQRLDTLRRLPDPRGADRDAAPGGAGASAKPRRRPPTIASTTFAVLLVEWFLVHTGVRSYSNVAESVFFLLALYQTSFRAFLLWAGVACAVRVTAVFAVLPLFLVHVLRICRKKGTTRGLGLILLITVGMGIGVGGAMCLVDYIFYGRLVFTPYNFLKFNVVMDVSRYYGVRPPYWYAVVLPVLAAPFTIFLAWLPVCSTWMAEAERTHTSGSTPYAQSLLFSGTSSRTLRQEMQRWRVVCVMALLAHSTVGHKEMRFVYFLLPLLLILSSVVVVLLCTDGPTRLSGAGRRRRPWGAFVPAAATVRRLFTLCWLASAAVAFVLLYGYRCGGPTLFREIRGADRHYSHLEVLTHCYAMPGGAQLHGKVDRLEWVDCPMALNLETGEREVTADRLFTEQPKAYALWRYLRRSSRLDNEDAGGATPTTDGRLTRAQWWKEARRLMPNSEPAVLPDGIILFQNTAIALEEELLRPMGFHRVAVVLHASYSFEPDEDRYLELWARQ
ncbi:GPI alpha-mannosyltransferase III [Novymonas esmeraldas]|uniref:Mannosyltransferase n=1 Tax=Novymonas esmeraldas TaxID=1808958 RepID=A0AAW0F6B2_9TRYP